MQPGSDPEDLQTILSRFHTWAGKNPGTNNGKLSAPEAGAVREVSYEEAMRSNRQRHKAQTRRAAATAAPVRPDPPVAPSASMETEITVHEETRQAPVAATLAPDLDVHFAPPSQPNAESTALTRRPSALATNLIPARPREKTPTRKKAASAPKPAATSLPAPHREQPKPVRVQPQAPVPPKPRSRRTAVPKKSVALALQPPIVAPRKPVFKKVLAKTVSSAQAHATAPSKSAPLPDRNRRITTRFTAAEQRRLERAAAQSGLTLSAWLRQCALLAEGAYAPPPAPALPARTSRRALPAPPTEPALFSAPAPSGLGNWLSLLRQRFLSSPARFSERA